MFRDRCLRLPLEIVAGACGVVNKAKHGDSNCGSPIRGRERGAVGSLIVDIK